MIYMCRKIYLMVFKGNSLLSFAKSWTNFYSSMLQWVIESLKFWIRKCQVNFGLYWHRFTRSIKKISLEERNREFICICGWSEHAAAAADRNLPSCEWRININKVYITQVITQSIQVILLNDKICYIQQMVGD